MTRTNQDGKPVVEDRLFESWSEDATDAEVREAIGMLASRLRVAFYRTNATKHGNTELQMREETL